jgi:hypothetical protein
MLLQYLFDDKRSSLESVVLSVVGLRVKYQTQHTSDHHTGGRSQRYLDDSVCQCSSLDVPCVGIICDLVFVQRSEES